jgi:hypothetical protein
MIREDFISGLVECDGGKHGLPLNKWKFPPSKADGMEVSPSKANEMKVPPSRADEVEVSLLKG